MRSYVKGSVTVEAALVFPIILFVISGIIRFGFDIHDTVVSDMLGEYLAVKENSILCSSYSLTAKAIDIKEIVNKGPFDIGNEKREIKKAYIRGVVLEYRKSIMLGTSSELPVYESKSRIKNSTLVRMVHIILNHAERILESYD